MTLRPQHVAPELLIKVTKALGITALDQWYHVSHQAASKAIGYQVLNNCGGSVAGFLRSAYPHHHFDEAKLVTKSNNEKDQKFIEVIIRQLFPNTEIHTKARKIVGIINPETDAYLELDFWIPSLKLGIEYQDKHHYGYQWYAHDTLENYKKRDDIKKATMSTLGYTLITIGYWWDKTLESVVATIRKLRPDLLQKYNTISAAPIPSDPPLNYLPTPPGIPGVSGIMNPFVPTNNFDPTNWYAGEKYDGIRGIYNPKLNKMFSRSGNELSVLSCLLKDVPNMLVEGEITAGRGNYNKTAVVSVHTQHEKVNWPGLRYVLYDIPDAELGNYTQRYSTITSELSSYPFVFTQSAFRLLLVNKAHLKVLVDLIISDSGEGVIAQQDARYEFGRAKGLAKIKVRRDADAQVLRVNKLSCTCKLVSGVTADIAFCAGFDSSKLMPGDIISYYHIGYSHSGLPKQGEIYKVRYDITWDELVGENVHVAKRRSVSEAVGSSSLIARNTTQHKKGHWNKPPNVRAFFNNFARTSGFDPLTPENWYPVMGITLRKAGGGGLVSAYGYNLKEALSLAYPELTFDAVKFRSRDTTKDRNKMGHWQEQPNVRTFCDEFARKTGFNPLISENWYTVGVNSLRNAGGGGLLSAHNHDMQKALSCAYPELNFDKGKFITHAIKGRWNKPSNVRAYLDNFASTAGFDPLVAENWNTVKHSTLQQAGGSGLLKVYRYNITEVLSSAYPELKHGTL